MQILVVPMYSKQELNADSNYVVYTALIRAMRDVRPNWHWTVVFPDAGSQYKYEPDGFFDLNNVSRVAQRISTRKMANAITYDGAWYDRLLRSLGFDYVWCNLPEMAGYVRQADQGSEDITCKPVTVAAHNYVMHQSLPNHWPNIEHVALAQCAGSICADWNVFNSAWCRQMWRETAERYFLPEVVERVMGKSSLINYGTLEPGLTPVATDNPVPVIAYNHRLMGYKNYRDTFALLDEIYRDGVEFRVRYMNNTSEKTSHIARYPFVEVHLCATREDYLAVLKTCDLNVTNSQHETFCIAAVESMALGQPLIAPNAITFPEITGVAETGYPYLFDTRAEQKEYLVKLLTDCEERKRWGAILSRHVRANFTQLVWADRYATLFEQLYRGTPEGTPEDTRAWVYEMVAEYHGKPLRALYQAVTGTELNGRTPFGTQSLSLSKLGRFVHEQGGRVVMQSGTQIVFAA